MSCLDGLVGLRDLCGVRTATHYLDDLPGIDQASLKELRTIETQTLQGVFDRIQARATREIEAGAKARFLVDFRETRKPRRYTSGRFVEECEESAIPTADFLAGRVFDFRLSEYLSFHLQRVQIRTQGALSSKIYVVDLYTGSIIEEIDYTTTGAGIHMVEIDKVYEGYERLFVAYDQRAVESLRYNGEMETIACTGHSQGLFLDGGEPSGADIRYDCLQWVESGLVVDYTVECSFDRFICAHKNGLALALWYAFGLSFWAESMVSREATSTYLVSEEIRERATSELKEQMTRALDNWAKTVEVDNLCFKTREKKIRSVSMIP